MVTQSGDGRPSLYPDGWQPLLQGPYWAVHLPADTYEDGAQRAEWQRAGFATMGPPNAPLTAGHPVAELCTECSQLPEGLTAGDQIAHMQGRARTVALAQAGRRARS